MNMLHLQRPVAGQLLKIDGHSEERIFQAPTDQQPPQQQQHNIYDESSQILPAQPQGVPPEPSTDSCAHSSTSRHGDESPVLCRKLEFLKDQHLPDHASHTIWHFKARRMQQSLSGRPAWSAQSPPALANSGQLQRTPGQQLDPSNQSKSLPQLQPQQQQQQMHPDSLMDLGTVPSKVSDQVPNTQSSSNQLALRKVSSRYLDRVKTVVQNLTSLQTSTLFQIDRLQCQYLCGKLCKSVEDAGVHIDHLILQDGNLSSTQSILERLLQAAKDVEILVKGCCSNEFIQAVILADSKEHFASLAFKVELYMSLLQNSLNEETKRMFLMTLKDWSNEVSIKELQMVDERANRDQEHLLSTMKAQVGSSNQMGNLIQRLETISQYRRSGMQNAGHVKGMWKEEQKNLQRVETLATPQDCTTVYKIAWHGKHFAEKCFHVAENESFKTEASILAGLAHPNIVPSFCSSTSDRSCSIVMELMDQNLFHLMQQKPLNAPFELLGAVDIMLQIAEGMCYLHQNRVIHRDLKSMNILVKGDEHVYAKVADFGLSKFKESSCTYSNQTSNQGTTRWMAPELMNDVEDRNHGQSHKSLRYHFKVDIYSFGMVCYEILTGRVPFHEINSMGDLRKIVKDGVRPVIPDRCPERLSTLIQRCYNHKPAARPAFLDICGELRHIICSLMLESAL